MAAARKREKQGNNRQRARRRTKKMVAAAGAMLLIPGVVASEPAASHPVDLTALDGVGQGLMGLTDPDSVNADGTLSQDDQIGADLLRDAGNPQQLGLDGLELPSGPLGIPGIMLEAYKKTEATLAASQPNCHLSWSLLASIARIESAHARGGQVTTNGDTINPILGPVLNGGGFAAIADTDAGRMDGDSRWDRAVGPFQFIPSTWSGYASDGNGDRIASPHNVFDSALAAGKYLCSGGMDLANPQQRAAAVFRYNHSDTYVRVVLIWADAYLKGVTPIESIPLPPITVTPFQQGVVAPPPDQVVVPGPGPSEPGPGPGPAPGPGPSNPPVTSQPTNPCPPTSTTPPTSTSTTPPTSSTPPSPSCPPSTTTPPTTSSTTTTPPTTSSNNSSGGGETSPTTTTSTTTTTSSTESSTTAAAGDSSTTTSSSETTSPVGP